MLLPTIDLKNLDVDAYRQAGLFILRDALPAKEIENLQATWNSFNESVLTEGRQIDPRNLVLVQETPPPSLIDLYRSATLLDIVEKIHGPDIALYSQRLLLKNAKNPQTGVWHQDFGYDTGWPDKTSLFIPLNPTGPDNGGLVFYPGTHVYGFLGSAGEINPDAIETGWPKMCPQLKPGDVILMHCFTWHSSGPYLQGAERAIVQITYQPSNDPSSTALARGGWRTKVFLSDSQPNRLFKRSKIDRLQIDDK